MSGRNPDEAHRAATPLELLFDLCFVVAVAQAAGALHHDLAEGEIGHGVLSYLFVFFAIWWPWVNFTWFASAYDTDDVLYRLVTFVQITGVLVVTAGVQSAFEALDFRIMVTGYVIMRIALVAQWLRVAREDSDHRRTALRFALAIALLQAGWALRLLIPLPLGVVVLVVLGVLEMIVPIWAESAGRPTPWNARHVSERYGLFTIIVIGECVLAATTAVEAAFSAAGLGGPLLAVAVGGLLLVFGLWWVYFKDTAALDQRASLRSAIAWSYGHYVIFAAIAALGAGLQVAVETTQDMVEVPAWLAASTVAVPVVAYLLSIGVLHGRSNPLRAIRSSLGVAVVLVLLIAGAATWIGVALAILAMGFVVAALIAAHVASTRRAPVAVSGAASVAAPRGDVRPG
jgi:low temperature requirement protein LtrA